MTQTQSDQQLRMALDQLYATEPPEVDQAQRKLGEAARTWREAIWIGAVEGTPVGTIQVAQGPEGIVATEFTDDQEAFAEEQERIHMAPVMRADAKLAAVRQQLNEYFSGGRRVFHLAVDLHGLTEFQRQVLRVTGQVPHGQLLTYGEVARRIGRPAAARAVGQALGRNPIPVIIPCHRVVGADGSLTGYSGGAGVETKAKLLQLEGAAF